MFVGFSDNTILVLTDDTNSDVIFIDDIYSSVPGTRLHQIQDLMRKR